MNPVTQRFCRFDLGPVNPLAEKRELKFFGSGKSGSEKSGSGKSLSGLRYRR